MDQEADSTFSFSVFEQNSFHTNYEIIKYQTPSVVPEKRILRWFKSEILLDSIFRQTLWVYTQAQVNLQMKQNQLRSYLVFRSQWYEIRKSETLVDSYASVPLCYLGIQQK